MRYATLKANSFLRTVPNAMIGLEISVAAAFSGPTGGAV